MQKRLKDLESKLANSERSGTTARQTLAQAQQRSEEWERLAKAAQGTAEMLETKLEQAEQTQAQLDADYEFAKMQLDEKEADSRLQSVRTLANEPVFRVVTDDNIIRIAQPKCSSKSSRSNRSARTCKANLRRRTQAGSPLRLRRSAHAPMASPAIHRPGLILGPAPCMTGATRCRIAGCRRTRAPGAWSRRLLATSRLFGIRCTHQATARASGARRHCARPSAGIAVSHQPHPKAQYAAPYQQYARAPSPTPSTVSAAPTQGDDGWWS